MASVRAYHEWYRRAAEANNLIVPVKNAEADSMLWGERFRKLIPAIIAHVNFGPCLVWARRFDTDEENNMTQEYFLVTLVNPIETPEVEVTRRGFYQIPTSVIIEGKDGLPQVLQYIFPVKKLITKFQLAETDKGIEDSYITVYDGTSYNSMTLAEFREMVDKHNDENSIIAFDAFVQSNSRFVELHDVRAPTVVSPALDVRLITSRIEDEEDVKYALAPSYLRPLLYKKNDRKEQETLISCAHPVRLDDPHDVITQFY